MTNNVKLQRKPKGKLREILNIKQTHNSTKSPKQKFTARRITNQYFNNNLLTK